LAYYDFLDEMATCGVKMTNEVIQQRMAYYRARAGDYDE
jgi:hypothetical protein